ncbi:MULTISPECIES: Eco57I restriction-modification methylase domain-containing protein [unclassified Nostoc]|uniref:Eco57I restriction-modification methylase domain-containing protein n=1 Tax=unclassified Nostoc TaxID=2593658 RepID=UPI0028C4077E|nr:MULTISPECIES: TaqI-like C-terminal specificity domain-containing protein [unclassified Nostoc]
MREALKGYLKTQVTTESSDSIDLFVDEHNPDNLVNPEAILESLRKVRCCDLAAGSGAYLLGMLHELLDLRQCLFAIKGLDSNTVYRRKLEIIENNLYGIDKDVFAVNIARLRLWLSLAVEYQGAKPNPLPNLKYKIEIGDSLTAPSPATTGMIRTELVNQYSQKKAEYMRTHEGGKKRTLEAEINELKTQIRLITNGSTQAPTGFDWAVEFAEVFADGGFDIQVANPPYVRQELIKDLKPTLQKVYPSVYTGTSDLYCFFYARALQLLKPSGMLAFISSNKWFRAKYGDKLKKHIADNCQVHSITDFGDLPVFQSAAVLVMIFIAQNQQSNDVLPTFTQVKSLKSPYPDVKQIIQDSGHILPYNALKGENWTLTDTTSVNRLRKMEAAGIQLGEYVNGNIYYGVKTGFNKAFIIDGAKRAELINQDPKSAEIIKPLAIGDDVRKWQINYKDKWFIYSPWDLKIDNYPAVKNHLLKWEQELKARPECRDGRYNWWCMARYGAEYVDAFSKPKIIYPVIAKEPRFALDTKGVFINDKSFIIPIPELYLLGILNSSLIWDYLKSHCSELLGKSIELRSIYMNKVPIPNASTSEREAISKLVQKCLDAKGVNCEVYEKEIDQRVAALYGL